MGRAIWKGDLYTKLSAVIMGAGVFFHGQKIKGLLLFFDEAVFIGYMIRIGCSSLQMLPSLGTKEAQKVWDESLQVFRFIPGDISTRILLMGVLSCFIIGFTALLWVIQLHHSFALEEKQRKGERVPSFMEDIRDLLDRNFHLTLMTLPVAGIVVFNIVPLVYMILMAFTTYSRENNQLQLFNWNGLQQFVRVLSLKGVIGYGK